MNYAGEIRLGRTDYVVGMWDRIEFGSVSGIIYFGLFRIELFALIIWDFNRIFIISYFGIFTTVGYF